MKYAVLEYTQASRGGVIILSKFKSETDRYSGTIHYSNESRHTIGQFIMINRSYLHLRDICENYEELSEKYFEYLL
jgi:hypothetical protein